MDKSVVEIERGEWLTFMKKESNKEYIPPQIISGCLVFLYSIFMVIGALFFGSYIPIHILVIIAFFVIPWVIGCIFNSKSPHRKIGRRIHWTLCIILGVNIVFPFVVPILLGGFLR
ncbi:hypothetical protein [Aureibacillus halotolerans]|uniref:Uncharacterized protein n=1 Tax=Aureibacillus halotolerans TaxID=1508390 RepID=A0A4V3D3X9_9BACI|nr:hypothetical protein [Aureibacillus halotolerans]TDQ32171.1 hypothetical protein EV213_13217 [Aureibacillus halotolerans]